MFYDRQDAGKQLAKKIQEAAIDNPLILALPKGGVPVAYEIAKGLGLPMEVFIARKLGAPNNPEFAFGAIAEGGAEYIEETVTDALLLNDLAVQQVRGNEEERIAELQKEFRGGRKLPSLKERNIIIVDDGVATGSTAIAAAIGAKNLGAKTVYIAAPVVAARSLVCKRRDIIDGVVSVRQPQDFMAVGQWYEDFNQVTKADVLEILEQYMQESTDKVCECKEVQVFNHDDVQLSGRIWFSTESPKAWVVFVHGSGSSYLSPRNNHVAQQLAINGYSSLLFDLLTEDEGNDRRLLFNIPLLSKRLRGAISWLNEEYRNHDLDLFLFGASTGAAAAIIACDEDPELAKGIVSRGGRPDLAGESLMNVDISVLLIVGTEDREVLELNEGAKQRMTNCELKTVEGAGHLFEEEGTLDEVIEITTDWLNQQVNPLGGAKTLNFGQDHFAPPNS